EGDEKRIHLANGTTLDADLIFWAIGRKPATRGLGLENAGVKTEANGAVIVDPYSRTSVDHIFAVGDVTNRVNLTPVAIREGAAFAETTAAAWGGAAAPVAYPIAVGRAAATHEIPLLQTVEFFLHAFASNLISAAVRLVPLGQTDGQRVLAALTPIFEVVATDAMAADLDDI
ncbi:MAG: FAD-dependent oxidoreductase, partial [Pseudomonadota bacterium]